LIVAVCGLPADTVTLPGSGAAFVRAKLAGDATPDTLAATVNAPVVAFAVNAGAVAIPDAFVNAVALIALPGNVPLAPLPGAENVTVTPVTGLLPASLTIVWRAVDYAVLTVALCGLPAEIATDAAAPTVLVIEKVAAVATPETVADTV